jgi:hypothetical protein
MINGEGEQTKKSRMTEEEEDVREFAHDGSDSVEKEGKE